MTMLRHSGLIPIHHEQTGSGYRRNTADIHQVVQLYAADTFSSRCL
jgi:hypothetical protein